MERELSQGEFLKTAGFLLGGTLLASCRNKLSVLTEDNCPNDHLTCRVEYDTKLNSDGSTNLKSVQVELEPKGAEVDFTRMCKNLGFTGQDEIQHCEERSGPNRPCLGEDHESGACSFGDWGIQIPIEDDGNFYYAGRQISTVQFINAVDKAVDEPRVSAIGVQSSNPQVDIKPTESDKAGLTGNQLLMGAIFSAIPVTLLVAYIIDKVKFPQDNPVKSEKAGKKEELRMTRALIKEAGGVILTHRDESGQVFRGLALNRYSYFRSCKSPSD